MEILFLALTFFLAGMGAELIGFGVSTISMSLLPFVLPLQVVIPLVAIISLIATAIVAYKTKTNGLTKLLLPLFGGSLVGIPFGLMSLGSIDERLLATILGVMLILVAVYNLFAKKMPIPYQKKRVGAAVGLMAGFFGATLNINGPLLGIHAANNKRNSAAKRKDIIATYMFVTGVFIVFGHTFAGRVTGTVITHSVLSLPFLALGIFVGAKLFKKLNSLWLRYLIYLMVIIAGLLLII